MAADINAFVTEERIEGDADAEGPLADATVAVKDNISTEGIRTTCGSEMLADYVPPYSATVVDRLTDAGATVVGKANMDEFGMGTTTETSAFGPTRNPVDADRVPGGSSGGSAAAVAAGDADLALGSDTGGSIRCPAAFCGVVGIKPTYGLVSRYGIVAYANSLEQIGPIAPTVTEAAIMLNAIAGHDGRDSTSAPKEKVDYKKALVNDVKGMKIGVPKEYFGEGVNPKVKSLIHKALEQLVALGAEYEEISLPYTEYALPTYYIIAPAECSSNLARFDGIRYGYRAEKFVGVDDLFTK